MMSFKRISHAFILLVIGFILSGQAIAQHSAETQDEFAKRMAWWQDARFGMFIHWGLYAIPAGNWEGEPVGGIGEWIQYHGQIKPRDYEPLADQFNPTEFDAKAWVKLMKDAGCKYFVITTKHHDGFALFRSEVSEYDIAKTPFGEGNDRDIMRELADAARAEGIRIGWYHSIMDWHHPDYLPRREWDDRSAEDADYKRYVKYMHAQVEEILTNYGPIDIIWFDGEWEDTWTHEDGVALYDLCRRLNPDLIINNRVDKGREGMAGMSKGDNFRGDFGTPEQEIPDKGFGPGIYWESCMTMNDTWGYKADDQNWKSTEDLVRNLIDIASKGGNYLLNVGPTSLGQIPQPSVERLEAIGQWMAVNGQAIYGTTASSVGEPNWGRITEDSHGEQTVLYLHVFDWPQDRQLLLPGLHDPIRRAWLLDGGQDLNTGEGERGVIVHVPAEPIDPIATVIGIELDGKIEVQAKAAPQIEEGTIQLEVQNAQIHGEGAALGGTPYIGAWFDPSTWVSGEIEPPPPGEYTVNIHAACASGQGGDFEVALDESVLTASVKDTLTFADPESYAIGTVVIPESSGRCHLSLKPTRIKGGRALMNLYQISLVPE